MHCNVMIMGLGQLIVNTATLIAFSVKIPNECILLCKSTPQEILHQSC